MSDTGSLNPVSNSVTKKSHASGDLHTIGEQLQAPTIINPSSYVGSLGSSGIPAREDHIHGSNIIYVADKPTLDALPTSGISIGTVAYVGTVSGTAGPPDARPRIWVWSGSAWIFHGWWAEAGRVYVEMSRVAGYSVTSGAYTAISWDTERVDTDNLIVPHATTGLTFTVPAGLGGLWSLHYTQLASSIPLNRHFAGILATTARTTDAQDHRNPGGGEDRITISTVLPFAAGDSWQFAVWHTHGSALNYTGWCHAAWIAP